MNPKYAIFIGAGGFAAGIGVGALATYLYLRKKMSDILNDAIDHLDSKAKESAEIGEMMRQGWEDGVNTVDAANAADDLAKMFNSHVSETKEAAKAFYNYGKSMVDVDEEYAAAIERLHERAEADYPGWDDEEPEREKGEWPPPYTISEMDFINTGESQEKVTITYFAGDDVLCDTDETVMDVYSTVGPDALEHFDESKVAYARNEKLGIDYEICWDSRSYSLAVHGIDPDEDDNRHRGRRSRYEDDDYE